MSVGAADLLVLLVFVVLVLDSRRLHDLARSTGRSRRAVTGGIPAGANPDRVGLTLRDIQMRRHVDWEDGGIGWDGPEILPVESDGLFVDQSDDPPVEADTRPEAEPSPTLPVLWQPFPALPGAGATGYWLERRQPANTTSSPTATRPAATAA